MAGPRSIFNPVSVNVNSAVAAPFLKNIATIGADRRRANLADRELKATALFRKEQLADADERLLLSREAQEFVQNADQRQKDKNIAQGQLLAGASRGLSFSGAARLDDPAIEAILANDKNYQKLFDGSELDYVNSLGITRKDSPEYEAAVKEYRTSNKTKFGYRNNFVLNNPGAGGDPQLYTQRLTAALMQTGDFTPAEAATHAANKTASLFPSTSENMQTTLINAFKPTAAQLKVINNNSGGGTTTAKTGANAFRNQIDVGSLEGAGELAAKISSERDLPNTRSTFKQVGEFFGAGFATDPGRLDPSRSQIKEVIGRLSISGITSSRAMEQALNEAFDPDDGNTIKDKYNFRTSAGYDELHANALKIQNAERKQINSKTGSDQTTAQAAANADATAASLAQQVYQEQVNSILAGGVPQRQTDAQLAEQFLSGLRPTPGSTPPGSAPILTQPPPGNQTSNGGGVVPPPVVDAAAAEEQTGGTGIPALDALLESGDAPEDTGSETGSSTLDTILTDQPEAEFSVGQKSEGEVAEDTIRDTLRSAGQHIIDGSPIGLFPEAAKIGVENAKKVPDLAASLVDSLSIRDSEINSINQNRAPADLRGLSSTQRNATLTKAKALLKKGKISYDDGPEGGTLNDKLIIAYRKYIADQK